MGRIRTSLLAVFACSGLLSAQETSGTIVGTVTDPTGGVIAGAKAEASSPVLVRPAEGLSDSTGTFQLAKLPPGAYIVTVTAPGFRTLKTGGVNVAVGRTTTIPLKMEVGTVSESVMVSAEAAQIDTASSTSAVNVTREMFNNLPKARSFDTLIQMAPGTRAESKSGQYSIDGASGSENAWIIDGVEVTNIRSGVLSNSSRIPYEFVQEVEVKSSGFEAQYPATTGGIVTAVTRSGSNDFHGQVGLYFDNDVLNARPRNTLRLDPRDTTQNTVEYFPNRRDPYRTLGPVFSLGGRIVRDKMWFFAGWSPTFTDQHRVAALADQPNAPSNDWHQTTRRDYLTGKLDYAPTSRLRTFFSYLYSPLKQNGSLPNQDGTSRSTTPFTQLGSRSPSSNYGWSATYTVTPRLLLNYHGGFVYTNTKSYGVPSNVFYLYLNSSLGLAGVPQNLQAASGNFTPNTNQTNFDKQNRQVHYADVDYIFSAHGQHSFKAGYSNNRLSNDVFNGYPNGYFRIGWNQTYTGVTVPGTLRGAYGYYINRVLGTKGNVSSNNEGFYLQDTWRVNRRLTLNLGVRFDREFVPAFRTDNGAAARAIEWGFGDKVAPRLGFALDVLGNGAWTIRGGYGRLFDQFKYELPRGSFGGDVWLDYVYPLNDPDITKINLQNTPGQLFERVDWRITSNDPNDNRIDPNLAPMRKHYYNLMSEFRLNGTTVASVRYTRNRLDRTIEDVGVLEANGENYFIGNPGYGVTADPKNFVGMPTSPKAIMNYDALEFRVDKRFSHNFLYSVSYAYSRLWGNYSGLASSDENGRTSPNVDRNFDLPWEKFGANGQPVYGLLGTDRPHTIKFFSSYTANSKLGSTIISPILNLYSGTPLSTEVGIISLSVLANGRGDLGRTPFYTNTDLQIAHEFRIPKLGEGRRLRLQGDIFNLFNQANVTNKFVTYIHSGDGRLQFPKQSDVFKGYDYKAMMTAQKKRVDPRFLLPSAWQGERFARLAIMFTF